MKQTQGRPWPLGVTVTKNEVNFSVPVPDGKECSLLLYHPGKTIPFAEYPMTESVGEVCYMALKDMGKRSYEYNYKIGRAHV